MIDGTSGTGGTSGMGGLSSAMGITPAGGELGKQEFLQLLVAQLRHQDPMSPMESQDFAVQLAQFSSVEQLMGVNEQLAGQMRYTSALAEAMNSSAAVGALGRDVVAVGDGVAVSGGQASITADIGDAGGRATVRIYDDQDRLLAEQDLGVVEGGRQVLPLDGLHSLEDGVYRYELDVKDSEGNEVATTSYVTGTVSGVKYGMEGPVLVIGAMEIPLGAVMEISAN